MTVHSDSGTWTKFACLTCAWFVLSLSWGCGGGQKAPKVVGDTEEQDDGERTGDRRAAVPELEDEDEDDFQIAGLKGRLHPQDIKHGLEPHQDALFACFTDKVGRRRYLGGEVEFQFVVNPDGSVKSVYIKRSDLGAWTMEKCMLDIARAIKFPEPEGKAEADFTVPLGFDARQRVKLWNDARAQEEVADERVKELAACAEETGTRNPGNIWLTIYIGTRGKVMSVGFASPDGPLDENWATCAAGKVNAWSLTDPRGRAKMLYNYNP